MSNNSYVESKTALKALRTLEVVAASQQELAVRDVAERLMCDKTTAYRMLVTLERAGFINRDGTTKRYSLSYKVVSLSRNLLAENEVTKLIVQTLREISAVTQETLHYSVLAGKEAVLVHKVKGSQLVDVDFQIGDRAPLHATAIGKVLLAYQDVRFIEKVISSGLPKMASQTIIESDQLRRELLKIRSQGYAIDDHELSDSMRCIAVPVFKRGGRVEGGISISGPDSRLTPEQLNKLREIMLESSRKLSRHLGGLAW
ncbi:MAG: IclR family transcriptional regulator [Spirochaetota bacterium]